MIAKVHIQARQIATDIALQPTDESIEQLSFNESALAWSGIGWQHLI